MKVAILGAGNGGVSAAVELARGGHQVSLWNRSRSTLEPLIGAGGIHYQGVLGEGFVPLPMISDNLAKVVAGAEAILVCLPTQALGAVADALISVGAVTSPVILNPGHTGGALEFAEVFRRRGVAAPPLAEFSTLTYVARKTGPASVSITGRAKTIRAAGFAGDVTALAIAKSLYDCADPVTDVLHTSLCNVNMVLHPPGALLGASWVEATGGDFTFYVQGLSDGVARVMEDLDQERCRVGAAFGHDLPPLFDEMQAIGTIEIAADRKAGLAAAIRAGKANSAIKAPDSLRHRYYQEDFWYGLMPFLALADIAQVDAPVAASLMRLCASALGRAAPAAGRTAEAMGIDRLNRDQLINKVKGK